MGKTQLVKTLAAQAGPERSELLPELDCQCQNDAINHANLITSTPSFHGALGPRSYLLSH